MSFKLGNTEVNKAYLGGAECKKAYLGSSLVFDNATNPTQQILLDNCSFYFAADTAGWDSNNYAPEVGSGNLVRTTVSQLPGIINEALNVGIDLNRVVIGDTALQNYDGLQFHENGVDVDYFVSLWVSVVNMNGDGYIYDFRKASPRSGSSMLLRNAPDNDILFLQSSEDGGAKQRFSIRPNTSIVTGSLVHIVASFNATTKLDKMWIDSTLLTGETYNDTGYTNKNGSDQPVVIGAAQSVAIPHRGKIDEFSTYKGIEATQELVDYLYNSGSARSYPFNE